MYKMMIIACCALVLVGCVSAPFRPPVGLIASVEAPLSTDGNWKVGSKRGEAACTCILGLWAGGDCSVAAAAEDGALNNVYHVDYEYTNILGIWQETKVIAYGD